MLSPKVIPRSQHGISRRDISKSALKVLYRLHDAGFRAYLVGGGVRDVLLGRHPKDFDIATDALPEEISRLFRNSRLIGRRFRLVHVHFGGHIVEVATFRAEHSKELQDPSLARAREDGMILRDNVYGTLEEDVFRRDFTINALYYNIADFSLLDYVDGLSDLKNKIIRIIGSPIQRYREDPVRILRAIRFAAKLNFNIHKESEEPIFELNHLLANVPSARLFDEYLKLFLSGHAVKSFELLRHYGIFAILFPETENILAEVKAQAEKLLRQAFANTDQRVEEDKPVNPAFLLAAILWPPFQQEIEKRIQSGENVHAVFYEVAEEILHKQRGVFSIPRRLTQVIRDIWSFQFRLEKRGGSRAQQLYTHPRFRAAYDFLNLRHVSGETEVESLLAWWTEYINADEEERLSMANAIKPQRKKKRSFKSRAFKPPK